MGDDGLSLGSTPMEGGPGGEEHTEAEALAALAREWSQFQTVNPALAPPDLPQVLMEARVTASEALIDILGHLVNDDDLRRRLEKAIGRDYKTRRKIHANQVFSTAVERAGKVRDGWRFKQRTRYLPFQAHRPIDQWIVGSLRLDTLGEVRGNTFIYDPDYPITGPQAGVSTEWSPEGGDPSLMPAGFDDGWLAGLDEEWQSPDLAARAPNKATPENRRIVEAASLELFNRIHNDLQFVVDELVAEADRSRSADPDRREPSSGKPNTMLNDALERTRPGLDESRRRRLKVHLLHAVSRRLRSTSARLADDALKAAEDSTAFGFMLSDKVDLARKLMLCELVYRLGVLLYDPLKPNASVPAVQQEARIAWSVELREEIDGLILADEPSDRRKIFNISISDYRSFLDRVRNGASPRQLLATYEPGPLVDANREFAAWADELHEELVGHHTNGGSNR